MFEYNICNQADEEIFIKQCEALENKILGIEKKDLLIDVDGSKIQKYLLNRKEITVINSNYTNDIYITSEVDLLQYFK